MKSRIVWPRVLALCSAVALGGGYVWWSEKKSEERRAREEAFEELERVVLPGSKSAWGFPPERSSSKKAVDSERTNADFIQETPADDEPRTMLPGSKSAGFSKMDRQSIEDILNARETKEEKEP